MEKNWYYVVDGVRYGPVTFSELHALTMAGAVKPLDLVWHPEFGPEQGGGNGVCALVDFHAMYGGDASSL